MHAVRSESVRKRNVNNLHTQRMDEIENNEKKEKSKLIPEKKRENIYFYFLVRINSLSTIACFRSSRH